MVVVVLIAISASFVVVNLDRDVDRIAEQEARRFALLVEQARDESILSGRPYAVQVDPDDNSYTFLKHDSTWAPVENDDIFRRRELPPDLRVSFATQNQGEPGSRDLLVIEGLGEITPFELTVRGERRAYTVSIGESQDVRVRETPIES